MADVSSSRAKKTPDRLYELCLSSIVHDWNKANWNKNVRLLLPDMVLMDLYYKMWKERKLCILANELSELQVLDRLLLAGGNQIKLTQCFQATMEHNQNMCVAKKYMLECERNAHEQDRLIELGIRLGEFLYESGWYEDAEKILIRCRDICLSRPQTTYYKRLTLECCHRLLHTQSSYCRFLAASETYSLILQLLGLPENALDCQIAYPLAVGTTCDKETQTEDVPCDRLELVHESYKVGRQSTWDMRTLLARVFKELSALFFVRCDFSAAHAWSMHALRQLTPDTPPSVVVEVLRACGKACVVKRRFEHAGVLVRAAASLALKVMGSEHPRYAAALLDVGFCLLNIDSVNRSVQLYEEALKILKRVYGRNLHVATAQEDLAYALYVLEYSSGRFYKAREHAEKAIRIIQDLVPNDHLLLASAKRVKALILEEIALDAPAGHNMSEPLLLRESEVLHKAALALSMKAFGEKNVQTAKHYGNLGRLYQSMQKFQDAESMHLKAIAIKEELLGPDDYEVGLSIGHLASLYNYHMQMYNAAEELYKRSIAINLKLFGERYSGLEYDYRGLVHVCYNLKQHEQAQYYERKLEEWHDLRERNRSEPQSAINEDQIIPIKKLQALILEGVSEP